MRRVIKIVPNTITSLNLFFGCMGIVYALDGNLSKAFCMMGISLVCDFFDGFSARLLKAYSDIGKELDSLADVVSFGVLPSAILFSMGVGQYAFIIAIFSALRLAKFNIDTRQSTQFLGLPTPANAIFFGAIGYIYHNSILNGVDSQFVNFISNLYFLFPTMIVMSLLLVSDIPMFALKFKSYGFKDNATVYIFLICSLITLILFQIVALPFIISAYILLSLVTMVTKSVS